MNPNALLRIAPVVAVLALAACSSAPKKTAGGAGPGIRVEGKGPAHVATGCPSTSPYAPAKEDPSKRGNYTAGGLYAPGVRDTTPDYVPNVACIPEPLVTDEPRSAIGNRSPYMVLGREYVVIDDPHSYVERGTASYYGSKFHGRLTSNREVYDMYAFTAAHKTLPLPSFALVTNLDNGESVVVRINDRGPFHDDRLIDLSYAAAVKLGITGKGTGRVEVRGLTPADNGDLLARRTPGRRPATLLASASTATATRDPAAVRRAADMDNLVKTLPATSAGTAGASVAAATTVPARAVPVAAVVAPTAAAATATAAALPEGERWRYRVQDAPGRVGDADRFDAWMKSRGVRVATGKPTTPAPSVAAANSPVRGSRGTAAATSTVAPVTAAQSVAVTTPTPAAPARAVATAEPRADADSARGPLGILLQVASFASRENANRALSQLASAGIVGASISDIVSGGRTLWRLRVAAEDHGRAAELATRIAGLGFGRPQIVKD
ncbi:septal ring lytic transglycosylase RlpA family protein [Xanthomonas sp. A2111]|uniref:Endolytic peptidoglycan transglycosylase RlpA n=1 Tax=Xanthomonas hawaiiensis TaxID=3003247 RepID=A0ABU2I4L1_9XANT|nr:septal ring lytic transglycosylase RlpA family protein [Xanthomonas sp. A2111]MBO9830151.1 septal ring lytic transglycosylase RlpA family protein [Xanthomonas sp. A2111]MDS9992332.1 septal ring lytic transglycosylase RlpA family protein [Xanthomonas sp. A2111]